MPKYEEGDQIEFRSIQPPFGWKRGQYIRLLYNGRVGIRYGMTVITRDLDGIRPIREPTVEGNTLCFKEE